MIRRLLGGTIVMLVGCIVFLAWNSRPARISGLSYDRWLQILSESRMVRDSNSYESAVAAFRKDRRQALDFYFDRRQALRTSAPAQRGPAVVEQFLDKSNLSLGFRLGSLEHLIEILEPSFEEMMIHLAEPLASWFAQPCVRLIQPTENHWPIFERMLKDANAVANLVTDAHLAALAIEHNCELQSTDRDFARFPDLKWRNPIA